MKRSGLAWLPWIAGLALLAGALQAQWGPGGATGKPPRPAADGVEYGQTPPFEPPDNT